MARVVRLTTHFLRRLRLAGVVPRTPLAAAVGATLAMLAEAEDLPGLFDTVAALPPTGRALVRRVPGRNVWIWYRVKGNEVVPITATTAPPMPIDR